MDIAAVAAAALRHISGVLNGRIKEDSRGRHICGGGRKEVQLSSPLPLAPVFLGRLQEVIREMRGDSRTKGGRCFAIEAGGVTGGRNDRTNDRQETFLEKAGFFVEKTEKTYFGSIVLSSPEHTGGRTASYFFRRKREIKRGVWGTGFAR